MAAGISGYVTAIPANFTLSTLILIGAGITNTVHAWGALLLDEYNTQRFPDSSAQQLTYWTDNGVCVYVHVWVCVDCRFVSPAASVCVCH